MKLKMDFMLRKVAGYYVVVPVGESCVDFNGMVNLNETGAFLFQRLQQETSREKLIQALLEEYEVDEATAGQAVDGFLEKLRQADLLA